MSRTLYWISNDLRLEDNPSLNDALNDSAILPVFIYDTNSTESAQGAAAWWLHHSLSELKKAYAHIGLPLHLREGSPLSEITALCHTHKITKVVCARAYTPNTREQQKKVHHFCRQSNIEFKRFTATLLIEPEHIQTLQNSYYKVFTPFSKQYQKHAIRKPVVCPNTFTAKAITGETLTLDDLHLLPTLSWADNFKPLWQPGEEGAHSTLASAIAHKVKAYPLQRNALATDGCSKLSAYLRFGEISPVQIWSTVSICMAPDDCYDFLRQLIWRDFNHHLLFHRPEIVENCFNPKFNTFTSLYNKQVLQAWEQGQTGYPVVDAAMAQLWHTGWMHNRARMIVASFLTKHLLQPWQSGAQWFWKTLLDADLANNIGGWQWTAGCGADAAPYFRIFNPITQGQKFDPDGAYTRKWLPQLAKLEKKYLFCPWDAPESTLKNAGIFLGDNYPHPIIDHTFARARALEAYKKL